MENRKHKKNLIGTTPWAFFSKRWELCGELLGGSRAEGHGLHQYE
jgi:hypothetical protein